MTDTPLDVMREYGNLGLAVLIVIGIGLWLWKGLWPFLTAQVETSQKRVDELAKQFSAAIEAQAKATSEVAHRFEQALNELRKPRR